MILSLTIKDRLIFNSVMPKIGSMTEMHIAENICNKISLSEEEIKEINLRKEGDNILFNNSDKLFELDLKHDEVDFLKLVVKIKDEKKEVTKEFYPLFMKINDL